MDIPLTQIPTILNLPPLVEAVLHIHRTCQLRNLASARPPKSNFIPTPLSTSTMAWFFLCPVILFSVMCSLASINALGLCSPDCPQETHWTPDLNDIIQRERNGDIFFSHGTLTARCVAILFNSNFPHHIMQSHHDQDGRVINLTLIIDGQQITITNIYMNPGTRARF